MCDRVTMRGIREYNLSIALYSDDGYVRCPRVLVYVAVHTLGIFTHTVANWSEGCISGGGNPAGGEGGICGGPTKGAGEGVGHKGGGESNP